MADAESKRTAEAQEQRHGAKEHQQQRAMVSRAAHQRLRAIEIGATHRFQNLGAARHCTWLADQGIPM